MHLTPTDEQAPGVLAAIALIAMYFGLQAGAGLLVSLILSVATGFVQLHDNIARVETGIQSMAQQPGMQATVVILTLLLAAPATMQIAYRRWPLLWTMGLPPGLGFTWPRWRWFFVPAIMVGLITPLIGGWITQFLANGHPVVQDISQLGQETPRLLRYALVLVVVSIGPAVEELLFRGVLLSALMARLPRATAMAVSSLGFAAIHLPGLQFQYYALPELALLAFALAWLRLYFGSIWPGILAHGVNNLLAASVWFAASSA